MIDAKKLGPALLAELQRRSVQKNADNESLLEELAEGSGAHIFVGDKTGEVSLLVPLADGFDGPQQVKVTIPGQEQVLLDHAKRMGTVNVEGVNFARFVLEPLRYADKLDGTRQQIALRGEGEDGLWSPLGFDDWFHADYDTLRWLATSDQMVVAPEVTADVRDPTWKALTSDQRSALEAVLQRPVATVVHDSTLQEALQKAKDQHHQDDVVGGALKSLSLSIEKKAAKTPRAIDRALNALSTDAELQALRETKRALQTQSALDAGEKKELVSTNRGLVESDLRFAQVEQSAELQDARRQLQIIDLTPGSWAKPQKSAASDACLDAFLWLADLRSGGSAKTLAALHKKLDHNATKEAVSAADQRLGVEGSWRFGDGSKVQVGKDDDGQSRCFLRTDDQRKVNVDLDKQGLFNLPTTLDPGPAAALLDAAHLQAANAPQELSKLGFTAITDRFFLHRDGSWAAMVPSDDGLARVAAGIGARRYDLAAPATSRANAFGALPAWMQSMVRLSAPAEHVDLQLMARQLAALDEGMLKRLSMSGYRFDITRFKLSNAQDDLKDISTLHNSQLSLVDTAAGLHRADDSSDTPSIVVRTYFEDGQLRLDLSTLLGTIGHAFDRVIGDIRPGSSTAQIAVQSQSRRKDPLHVEPDYADAYTKEHQRLPAFFHQQDRFVAETFALYMLDPVRCRREFPLAFAAHEQRFASMKPDPAKLFDLERGFDRDAVVAPSGQDLRKVLAYSAQQNRVLRDAGIPTRPLVVHLQGKSDWGSADYVKDAARHLRNSFGKEAGVYRPQESFVPVSAATFNSALEVEKLLTQIETSGRPALLFIEDAAALTPGSAGFAVYEDFVARGRDVPPLVLGGEKATLQTLEGAMPTVMRTEARIEALSSSLQSEAVQRLAAQDGFVLASGVVDLLAKKLKGGSLQQAGEAWRAIKAAQFQRQFQDPRALASSSAEALASIREITTADVQAMKISATKTPQERLAALIGQEAAKREIDAIVAQARVAKMRREQGLPEAAPLRLNLLFSGAPGTGKTTYAEILGSLLQEIGYIKNPVVTKVTIQDLLTGSPEAAIKSLFEANRGGVIFLDEMHQLKDTAEGKRAFRAMIPYLADPAWADTVFIGAGYSDELGELIRDGDPGAERRFTTVPFLDYSRVELGSILDLKAKDLHLSLDDQTREAALAFLDHRKRTTKNFGNAGEIDIALNHAAKAQTLRIAALPPSKVNKRTLMELKPEDFALPTPITKEAFWAEMDGMSGWDDIKAQLRKMAASVEGAVKRGKAPTDAVEPYWIIDGPPGTGKSTLARLLSKFGAAYGLIAVPEVVDLQGANLQGEFVGQTSGVVQKQFERSWGRLMFVDEVSGLAKSGGDFKFEAAKIILAQTENHRGKFMMIISDYAENINQFLKLDPGLARRFGKRITLPPWTAAQATSDLVQKMGSDGVDVGALQASLERHFAALAKVPGYASGGDVRTLRGTITALLDASASNDPKLELPAFIDEAFKALIEKKHKDAAPAAQEAS